MGQADVDYRLRRVSRRSFFFFGFLIRMDEAVCSFAHCQTPFFDLATCALAGKLGFEDLVLSEPVTAIEAVVYEIGGVGQTEEIGRGEVHTDTLHEIEYIQFSTLLMDTAHIW